MQELFLRTLRWFIVVGFVIAGLGALHLADISDSIKPVLPGIVCLGAAFVLGTAWKDLRRKILFITIVLVVALAYAAQYMTIIVYLLTGSEVHMNYFIGWGVLTLVAGFPAMMVIFHKYAD
ncbi:MAG: hypothetical protein WBK55_01375 [Alphaproteobacteria bacterium]